MNIKRIKNGLKNCFKNNDKLLFEKIGNILNEESDKYNQLILLESQLNKFEGKEILQLLESDQQYLFFQRINNSLLEIIDNLTEKDFKDGLTENYIQSRIIDNYKVHPFLRKANHSNDGINVVLKGVGEANEINISDKAKEFVDEPDGLSFEISDLTFQIDNGVLSGHGDIVNRHRAKNGEKKEVEATLEVTGFVIDGWIYVNYHNRELSGNAEWFGVAVFTRNPKNEYYGYWMTRDIDNGKYLVFGSFSLEPKT